MIRIRDVCIQAPTLSYITHSLSHGEARACNTLEIYDSDSYFSNSVDLWCDSSYFSWRQLVHDYYLVSRINTRQESHARTVPLMPLWACSNKFPVGSGGVILCWNWVKSESSRPLKSEFIFQLSYSYCKRRRTRRLKTQTSVPPVRYHHWRSWVHYILAAQGVCRLCSV